MTGATLILASVLTGSLSLLCVSISAAILYTIWDDIRRT